MNDGKKERIVKARLTLRRRFLHKLSETPSLSDRQPLGSGELNRHGMPRLPIGQSETKRWPVLDLGQHPTITPQEFKLTVDGAVNRPLILDWRAFQELEQVVDTSDFHCVTKWSRFDMTWCGVLFSTIAALAEPVPNATHLMCYGSDGYTTNLPIEEALKNDVLLAHTVDGEALAREHGGPLRMITPQLYAWKGAKWIERIEFLTVNRRGFWETRGYSNSAHPWRNDRYS